MSDDSWFPPLNGERASSLEIDQLLLDAERLEEFAKPVRSVSKLRILYEGLAVLSIGQANSGEQDEYFDIPFIQIRGPGDDVQHAHEYTLYLPQDVTFQATSDCGTTPETALEQYDKIDWTVMPTETERLYMLGRRACELQIETGVGDLIALSKAVAGYYEKHKELPMDKIAELVAEQTDLVITRSEFGFEVEDNGTVLIARTAVEKQSTNDIKQEAYIRYYDAGGNLLAILVFSDGTSDAEEFDSSFDDIQGSSTPTVKATTMDSEEVEISLPCDGLGKHQYERIRQVLGMISVDTKVLDDTELKSLL